MFNIFKKPDMYDVTVSMSEAGLLVSYGAKDYLLHKGAESDSFIANYTSAAQQERLEYGHVIQISIPRLSAATMGLI